MKITMMMMMIIKKIQSDSCEGEGSMVSTERRSKAGKQKPLRRVMLSSCKNTAWERSKCLRHPQPPALGCPARSWGLSGDPRLDQDPRLPWEEAAVAGWA